MRILHVTDFYHPYAGGVEIHVRTVAAEQAARGHDVAVATLTHPDGRGSAPSDGPVTVYEVEHVAERIGSAHTHAHRLWAPPLPDPITVRQLRAVVRDHRPDVIHGHDWLARSVLPAAASGSVPIVTSVHYYTRNCAKKTLWRDGGPCDGPGLVRCLRCAADHYGRAKGTVVALGVRAGAFVEDRRTSRWISVSAATAAGNGLAGRQNATVIANPLPSAAAAALAGDADDRGGGQARPEVLSELGERPFICFVGDIRPEKGLAVLREAVEELRRRGDDTPLVVVGERMSTNMSLPSGTVEVGQVDNATVQQLWRCATVGVVPSLWPEPFGLVAIEAMAAGCPLVASDVGGLSDILADDRGELVPPGDPMALAEAIQSLLGDPARRARLSARAIEDLDRFSVPSIVDRIEQEYRTAIDGRSRG